MMSDVNPNSRKGLADERQGPQDHPETEATHEKPFKDFANVGQRAPTRKGKIAEEQR